VSTAGSNGLRPRLYPLGDRALRIVFGDRIDPALNRRVLALATAVADLPGISDRVPAYASLTLHYDPAYWTLKALEEALGPALAASDEALALEPEPRLVTLPVCYGGVHGPDLEQVAQHCQLDPAQVIAYHTAPDYWVYFLGFMPGFAYLGGLDPRLATPRLETPRPQVPPGAVGIAGLQTGVYPLASPGGWRLIGQTPRVLFDPRRPTPCTLMPGDQVRFVAIDADTFDQLKRQSDP